MSKKIQQLFFGVACVLSVCVFSTVGVAAQSPTQGEIVIERDNSTTPTVSSSTSSDRVDHAGKPIKKTGRLPSTGELAKPVLLMLGGILILAVLIGFRYSTNKEKNEEEEEEKDE